MKDFWNANGTRAQLPKGDAGTDCIDGATDMTNEVQSEVVFPESGRRRARLVLCTVWNTEFDLGFEELLLTCELIDGNKSEMIQMMLTRANSELLTKFLGKCDHAVNKKYGGASNRPPPDPSVYVVWTPEDQKKSRSKKQ